jgi:multidrug resistance efflux pump
VLAEIETPELDQQVNQARAAVEQAAANLTLATTSYGRWQEMQKSRIVASQEVDERKGAHDARKAGSCRRRVQSPATGTDAEFPENHRAVFRAR